MKWFVRAVGVIFLLMGIFALSPLGSTLHDYEGTEVFNSEQEYTQFKRALVDYDVEINSVTVLSSSPPIIVKFSVDPPGNTTFPYGKEEKAGGYTAGGVGILIGIGVLYASTKKEVTG